MTIEVLGFNFKSTKKEEVSFDDKSLSMISEVLVSTKSIDEQNEANLALLCEKLKTIADYKINTNNNIKTVFINVKTAKLKPSEKRKIVIIVVYVKSNEI